MKLQKHLSRRYRGKDYPKWLVVIPPKVVEDLGWEEGDEIEPVIQKGDLRLHRAKGES